MYIYKMSDEGLSSDTPIRKRKAWAITIRPKNGITDEHIKMLPQWLSKWSFEERLYAVTEMEDEKRHIHGVFLTYSDKDIRQDNLKRGINTVLKKSLGECWSKHSLVLKYCYNHDWINKYCSKEHRDNAIYDSLGEYDDFLPSAEEQLEAIRNSNQSVIDRYFHKLVELWQEFEKAWDVTAHPVILKYQSLKFIDEMMFVEKRISVIRDKKVVVQVAEAFLRYSREMTDPLRYMTQEEKDIFQLLSQEG